MNKKKSKINKKGLWGILFITFFYFLIFGNIPFVNKYILPKEFSELLVVKKFSKGQCVRSDRWGINPKKVIGYKDQNNRSYYLLKDNDRHEHLQYISQYEVNRYGKMASCRI